ncbi:hypothetical protein [Streptomyces sp. NPDC091217]|uniref:hypothetical protein n=1 Tax=Streptomyces sp. NPDC091217 TaxID=3365975 RepID=UPI003822DA0A
MSNPISSPTVFRFDSTREAYDATQCRDDIRDGDVLVVESEKVIGFLDAAWPIAITEAHGEFHRLTTPAGQHKDGRFAVSADLAQWVAKQCGFPLAVKNPCEHCSCWAHHANGLSCCKGCGAPGHAMTATLAD